LDEVGHECSVPVLSTFRVSSFDDHVLTFDEAVVSNPWRKASGAFWRGGEVGGVSASHPIRHTFAACCASAASGASARLSMTVTASPIARNGHLGWDGWRESIRGIDVGAARNLAIQLRQASPQAGRFGPLREDDEPASVRAPSLAALSLKQGLEATSELVIMPSPVEPHIERVAGAASSLFDSRTSR
jgi:hypothetical protein